jgi:glycosyltransferase involved in cell wall biosynthesis
MSADTLMGIPRTVVVVPCYNEATRLNTEAFADAVCQYPGLQFLFVDDGSTDDTANVLKSLSTRDPARLLHLSLTPNRGKAEAVRQGLLEAFDSGAQLVGFLDADLATPIAELPLLAHPFSDPNVVMVMASRVAMLGRAIDRSPWRHYFGRVFATLASLLLGLRVYDTQCGAKLFRNVGAIRDVFARPFMSSWAFDVEILARLLSLERIGQLPRVERAVVEVPLRQWTDVRGSKITLVDSIVATSQLLLMWWRYRR